MRRGLSLDRPGPANHLLARTLAGLVAPACRRDRLWRGRCAGRFERRICGLRRASRRTGPFPSSPLARVLDESLPTVDAILTADAIWRRNPTRSPAGPFPTRWPSPRTANGSSIGWSCAPGPQLHHLSDGEARRVQIRARAAQGTGAPHPGRPFTGLDRHFREALRRLIPMLVRDGLQVILVLPDGRELPQVVTHVLALDREGRRAGTQGGAAAAPRLALGPAEPACLCPSGHCDNTPAAHLSESGARAAEPSSSCAAFVIVPRPFPSWTISPGPCAGVRSGRSWAPTVPGSPRS